MRELHLPSVAQSVRAARQFLRDLLAEAGRERWSDAAELALSEVVTNGVLHAHTELTVRVYVRDDEVEVEVEDGNTRLPTQRRAHDVEATTGRGLELVSALTRECGVRPEADGKIVWFTIGDEPAAEEPDEEALLSAWEVDAPWELDEAAPSDSPPPAENPPPAEQDVVLKGLPPMLWHAAREHHQAILRELVLYLAEHADRDTARPDMTSVDEARNIIWTALLAEVDRARSAGTARRPPPAGHPGPPPDVPATVDLHLSVPVGGAAGFAAMQDALDLGERLAVADLLLVRPGLPEIIAVRDWACEQVVAQLAGVPAAAWPGTDQARFTDQVHHRTGDEQPQWDDSLVSGSDRGVVAADDANRIIAISEPLALRIGWTPAEIVGRRVVALIPPLLREAHVAGFSRHLTTGETHVLGVELVLPVLCRDGTELACRFLIERAEVGKGRTVYLAWIDPLEP